MFRSKKYKILICYWGLVGALGLVVGEGYLRFTGRPSLNFYQQDPQTGYRLMPHFEGIYKEEGFSHLKINREGFRDSDHKVFKGDGVFRVAVLGDSFVESVQVEQEENLTTWLQKKLAQCKSLKGQEIEVFNFGVGGYGTSEAYLTYFSKVKKYKPDFVVLLFTLGNDVLDNLRPIHKLAMGEGDYNKASLLSLKFRQSVEYLASKFHLVQLAFQLSRRLKSKLSGGAFELDEQGLQSGVFREPVSPLWIDGWQTTERLLERLADQVRKGGSEFLLVSGSTPMQVSPQKQVRLEYQKKYNITDEFYGEKKLEEISQRHHFKFLALAPIFQKTADDEGIYYHGFKKKGWGHWNELGHQKAALHVSEKVCKMAGQFNLSIEQGL